MKLKTYLLLAFTSTICPTFADTQNNNTPQLKYSGNTLFCQDNEDDDDDDDDDKLLTKKEAEAFLKEKMPFLLDEFNEFMQEDEDEIEEILEDITEIKEEYMALLNFKPELGALFLEIEKLDFELHQKIEAAMEKGAKPEEAIEQIKDTFTLLFTKRIELEKGSIALAKSELDGELKEIEKLEQNKDAAIEEELKELLKYLKEDDDGDEDEDDDNDDD